MWKRERTMIAMGRRRISPDLNIGRQMPTRSMTMSTTNTMTSSELSSVECRCTAGSEAMSTRISLLTQLFIRRKRRAAARRRGTAGQFRLLHSLHHLLHHLYSGSSLRIPTQLFHQPIRIVQIPHQNINPERLVLRQPKILRGGEEWGLQAEGRDGD